MAGWIKLHRKIKEHWLWQDAEKLRWWFDILIEANHDDRKVLLKGVLVECKRGQCVKSLETWAKEWRTTKKTVRCFFSLLQKDSMILSESVTVSTRITICNYESYQDEGHEKETQSKRRVNAGVTQTRIKELKKEYRPRVFLLESEYDTLVEKFKDEGVEWILNKLDTYKLSKGKTYASDYGAINSWVAGEYEKRLKEQSLNNHNEQQSSIPKADAKAIAAKYG